MVTILYSYPLIFLPRKNIPIMFECQFISTNLVKFKNNPPPPKKNGFIDKNHFYGIISVRSSTCAPHQWTSYSLTE